MLVKKKKDNGRRPAAPDKPCFYCSTTVEGEHLHGCVIPHRTVVVRMVTEYVVDVPKDWDKQQIEFHRNDGSWCIHNDIKKMAESDECWCQCTEFEYIRDATRKDHEYLPEVFDKDNVEELVDP